MSSLYEIDKIAQDIVTTLSKKPNMPDEDSGNTQDGPSASSIHKACGTGESKSHGGEENDTFPSPNSGMRKYRKALCTLFPYRKAPPKKSRVLPSSHAGLISFATFSWLTPLMWKAFRKGLTTADLWELDDSDKAERNANRLKRIWNSEKAKSGVQAKFIKAVWAFGRTRFCLCVTLMLISVIFQFLGPAWLLKALLVYQEDYSQRLEIGITLAVVTFWVQVCRNLSFSSVWAVGHHTAARVQGAIQYLTYEKLLRLRSGEDKLLGKAVTFCTIDQERIFECVTGGVFVVAAPIMFILCLVYSTIVLGPWALVGNFVIFLFYPLLSAVGRFVGTIRRKTVKYTTLRVSIMTEILTAIRLIKMYAWEDSFIKKIDCIRQDETRHLRKSAFCMSASSTLTPVVSTIAAIFVFLGFSLAGNNLTPSDAFTIFAVFNSMQFTMGTLPYAIRSIAEAAVSFANFQKFLELPEYVNILDSDVDCHHDSVLVIKNGIFAWETEQLEYNVSSTDNLETKKNGPKLKLSSKHVHPNSNGQNNLEELEELAPTQNVSGNGLGGFEKCLKNINLEVKRGSLFGIAGSVGSGKSSLFSAIMGDMIKIEGKILLRGSLAIVSQEAWIYSDTLQANILFGAPMNSEKYKKVLQVCSLERDMSNFPDGDMTLIGERGVNLSGGQKQRVNLARAIYADKSVYLLDDPLAAVDAIVAQEIFQNCLQDFLRDKTVVLVTNAVQFLEKCDRIAFLKDGELVEEGTHDELVARHSHYYSVVQFHSKSLSNSEDVSVLPTTQVTPSTYETRLKKRRNTEKNLMDTFEKEISQDDSEYKFAGWKSVSRFIKAAGGIFMFTLVILFMVFYNVSQLFASVWVQRWLDAGDGLEDERRLNMTEYNITFKSDFDLKGYVNNNPDIIFYQLILFSSIIATLTVGTVKGYFSAKFVLNAAYNLHNLMLTKVIRSPLKFFDKVPMGKITSRFSKDMDEMDSRLSFLFEFVLQSIIFIFLCLCIICVIYPIFAVGVILILALMTFLDVVLNFGVRESRKLESVLKSPVVHHLQSTMSGLSIIRTFRREEQLKARFSNYVNIHLSADVIYRAANRWFTFRMEVIGVFSVFGAALISVIFRGSVSPAMVGLALTVIYSVCTFVPFVMRMKSELQARFISVERVLEYVELDGEESPATMLQVASKDGWPTRGEIVYHGINMKYGIDGNLVLNNVSLSIEPSEKVGIIGRTGAGKTSLLSALMRLYDFEGKITIDNVDICQVSLSSLRSSISVIPQDPILFVGTLRYNLDPFDKYSDDEIWAALEKSHMNQRILKESLKLETRISTDGENFSVGEKQLICLARALLRQNKVLVLDEATASLDIETDSLIQQTIKNAFSNCTVLTIAHRLNTITSSNRIIIMDEGKVVEMDTPQNLMANSNTLFYKMMKASGITSIEELNNS